MKWTDLKKKKEEIRVIYIKVYFVHFRYFVQHSDITQLCLSLCLAAVVCFISRIRERWAGTQRVKCFFKIRFILTAFEIFLCWFFMQCISWLWSWSSPERRADRQSGKKSLWFTGPVEREGAWAGTVSKCRGQVQDRWFAVWVRRSYCCV